MGFSFDISGSQIDGARDYQEDAFLITHLGDKDAGASLVIVADGMGGHAAGNVASNMAVQAFNRHISTNFPSDRLHEILHEAAIKANTAIAETVRETPALKGMGCTLVCAVFEDKYMRWVSVGDSHLYLLRNKELRKKNADHSYGGFLDRMAAEGKAVEPEPGFSRNMLMSAVTGEDISDIDCPATPLELQAGDRVIICSDGLDTLTSGKIIYFCEQSPSAKECTETLLRGVAEENVPRQDNTTVVVIDVHERAAAPAIEEVVMESVEEDEITEPKADRLEIPLEEEEPPRPKGRILLIGAVAALAILAAVAGFLMMSAEEPAPVVTEPEPEVASEPEVEVEAEAEPEPEAPPEPAPEPAPAPVEEAPPVAAPAPAAPAPDGSFRDALKSGGTGPEMVWLPAGSFTMGSSSVSAEFDERPTHQVRIERVAIGRYEVTFAQYERFANATGRQVPDNLYMDKDTHPVVFVSWDDAVAYTNWLSSQTGHKYRLPSEAEWEYAARGGVNDEYWWGRRAGEGNAHCFGCETGLDPRKPTSIGRFKPNPFGLYETLGNVAEWVYDCYHKTYEGAPTDGSVWEGGDCSVRIVRGGSFASTTKSIRSAKRDSFKSNIGNDNIGFRVARDP
jgi:formylglycine-generating enzyme required for sulfatase activity/serine/threonine protein phosphatase PrpC